MSSFIERNLANIEAWRLSPASEPSEHEVAYLYNDIGPLLYVFNTVTEEMRTEVLERT